MANQNRADGQVPANRKPRTSLNSSGWASTLLIVALIPFLLQVGMLVAFHTFYPLQPFQDQTAQACATHEDSDQEYNKLRDSDLLAVHDTCIISFSDLHGDLSQARAALQLAGVSNSTHTWAAGACTFVQTGDLVDRGPRSLEVVKLFEEVKQAAVAGGGRFIALLGNHELMNLQGQFHYLSASELSTLSTRRAKQQKQQEADEAGQAASYDLLLPVPAWFQRNLKVLHRVPSLAPYAETGAASWAGLLSAQGWLGQAVRSKHAAAVVGEGGCRTLFVHAGLLPDTLEAVRDFPLDPPPPGAPPDQPEPVQHLNAALHALISTCDGSGSCPAPHFPRPFVHELFGDPGPLWTREVAGKAAAAAEGAVCAKVAEVLRRVGAQRMVVGHTIQDKPGERCGGQVLLMDVGMSGSINGHRAAFRCEHGKVSVLFEPRSAASAA